MKINTGHKYFKISLCAFGVVAASIILFWGMQNLNDIGTAWSEICSVLSPFFYAFAIAYILNYPYRWFMGILQKATVKKPMRKGFQKAISAILTYVLFIVLVGTFFYIVAPQIVNAIMGLIDIIPHYAGTISADLHEWLMSYFSRFHISTEDITKILNSIGTNITQAFNVQNFMMNIVNLIISMSIGVKNFLLGVIISIYFLIDKERFILTGKKFLYAVTQPEKAKRILDVLRFTDKTFGGFIIAKVVDSMIIGLLCYLGMLLLRLDYAVLISVIVGITNIIPFFGPFIGAIPSALLLLMVNPWQALVFVIFIIVLQQFDGNFLGPKLLGDSTGIRAIYVVFAVIVGGGLFGFIGMFIGVPFFAVIYSLFSEYINHKLERKNVKIE